MRWFKCISKEEREALQKSVAAERERKRQELQTKLDVYARYEVCRPTAESDGQVRVSFGVWSHSSYSTYSLEDFYKEYRPKLEYKLLLKAQEQADRITYLNKDLDTIANGEKAAAEAALLKYKKQTLVYSNISDGTSYPSRINGYWITDNKLYVNGQEVVTKKPKKQGSSSRKGTRDRQQGGNK